MRHFITSCVVLFSCSLCYAIEAAPTALPGTVPLKQGHFGTGLEYVYADLDVRTDEAFFGPVRLPPITIKQVQIDRVFFVPSYALLDNITLVGRLGGTRMDIDKNANSGTLAGQQGTSDWGFTAGGGARAVLYKKDRLSWSVSGLVTWTELEGFNPWHAVFNGIPVNGGNMKLDFTDYQFATGPAYEIIDGWTLSAGPYFQFIDAKSKVSAPVLGQTVSTTVDIHQDEYFGGYISSQLMFTRSAAWNARFSATGSGYTISTGITVAF